MGEPAVIGLHVRESLLSQAKLRRAGGRIEILALEKGSRQDRETPPADAPASVPGEQLQGSPAAAAGLTGKAATADSTICIASMPSPDVMTRWWTLPRADDVRSRQMVAHRLEADLPIPIDQLVWGYRRGGPASAHEPTTCVLAQAARKDRVDRYLTSLSAGGLCVDTLTTEAQALAALYRYGLQVAEPNGTEAVVLAGPDEWLIAVLVGGVVRSMRRVYVETGELGRACRELQQCIDVDRPANNLRRVLWCASPQVADVRHALEQEIAVALEPVAPVGELVEAGGERISVERFVQFGPALGLALAGLFERDEIIRFAGHQREKASPRRQRIERILARPKRWTAIAGALVILSAAIHVGAVAWETRSMNQLLDGHRQANSAMVDLGPKIRAMQRVQRYRIDVEAIAAELCRQVPDSIVISSVQLSRERGLVIKGTASKPKAIFTLADALRTSDRFTKVRPGRTEPGKGGGFSITAELVGVETFSSSGGRGGPWR